MAIFIWFYSFLDKLLTYKYIFYIKKRTKHCFIWNKSLYSIDLFSFMNARFAHHSVSNSIWANACENRILFNNEKRGRERDFSNVYFTRHASARNIIFEEKKKVYLSCCRDEMWWFDYLYLLSGLLSSFLIWLELIRLSLTLITLFRTMSINYLSRCFSFVIVSTSAINKMLL